jgi:hypothetical protein
MFDRILGRIARRPPIVTFYSQLYIVILQLQQPNFNKGKIHTAWHSIARLGKVRADGMVGSTHRIALSESGFLVGRPWQFALY